MLPLVVGRTDSKIVFADPRGTQAGPWGRGVRELVSPRSKPERSGAGGRWAGPMQRQGRSGREVVAGRGVPRTPHLWGSCRAGPDHTDGPLHFFHRPR